MRLVFAEPGLDDRRIDPAAPVTGNEIDDQAELVGDLAPERGEVAGFEHQHPVARRQRVDQRGLPGTGARRGVDDDWAVGLENLLQPIKRLQRKAAEFRPAMVDRRLIDRAQDAIGHIRRPGNLQEVPAAGMIVESQHEVSTEARDSLVYCNCSVSSKSAS